MSRCAHCAKKLPKRAVVCPYCGFPVTPGVQSTKTQGNLWPIVAGVMAGLVLVIILGIDALFGYKGGWLDFGPRRTQSQLRELMVYRLIPN